MRNRASVLVGVLWAVALLSVIVIGVLHTARLDMRVAKNHGDQVQAHYLALAGIEKAKALLYQDALERRRTARNHTGELYDAPQEFRDVTLGRGQFRVFRRGRSEEGNRSIYGISDEESRLNVNTASPEELGKLYGMTPERVAAILDWRDEDNAVTPGGAEAEYYAGLQPPGLPRNGPLETVRELLMVRGISSELLFGRDLDPDAFVDPAGAGKNTTLSSDPWDTGWFPLLTVDSLVQDLNAAGDNRVNIQSADENSLAGVRGISPPLAKAIVAYRGQHHLDTVVDLLDVVAQNPNQRPQAPNRSLMRVNPAGLPTAPGVPPPNESTGEKLVSADLLMDIADDLTTASREDLPGMINLNTAAPAVLACLPGIDPDLAQAIVSYRQSNGFLPNIAWLLKVPGLTRDIFKQVAPRVTARSETFRILSEGRVNATGARQRIQAIVHISLHGIDTLSYQENL